MSFQISAVPFTVNTGADLTATQRSKFAADFELIQKSGTPTEGNLAVWSGGKLADGGVVPDVANAILKKAGVTAGNFTSFTSDGDIQDSGKKASDFVTSTDVAGLVRIYKSLGELGITSMDSTDWAANIQTILSALFTEGRGLIDIPYLYGSAGSAAANLASSISNQGTNGGQSPFSPSQGRFRIGFVNAGSNEITVEIFRENRMAICSTKGDADWGSGSNWTFREVNTLTAEESTDIARTKVTPLSGYTVEVYATQKKGIVYVQGYIQISSNAVEGNPVFQLPPAFPAPPPGVVNEFSYRESTRILSHGGIKVGGDLKTFFIYKTYSGASTYYGSINMSYPADWAGA